MKRKELSKEEKMQCRADRAERRKAREQRKEMIRFGGWKEVISAVAVEEHLDVVFYRERLENASITLDMLRDMALNRGTRLHIMKPGTIEISFRKGDHTAATTVTADGRVSTMMKDFLDY